MNRLERAVRKSFDVRSASGDELLCVCRWHEDTNPSLYINVVKGLYVCFSCGESGGPKDLARVLKMNHRHMITRDPASIREQTNALMARQQRGTGMPESTLRAYQSTPTSFWHSRGFSDETIKLAGLGFDIEANAGTIPFRDHNGTLLGVIRRYLDPEVKPKYRYPTGAPISKTLWGSWLMRNVDEVAVCEGPLDAVALWDANIPAVSLLGCRLSTTQERLLSQIGVSRFVLFLDNDRAGREATDTLAKQLSRRFLIRAVDYPDSRAKDPGELTTALRRKAFDTAVLYRGQ